VPAHYETYLLSRVIHDWDDDHAIALLTNCQQAMKPEGKVLLVERVIIPGTTPELLVLETDIHMLVASGGKERTEAEHRALLGAAGLAQTRLLPVLPSYYLIARCADVMASSFLMREAFHGVWLSKARKPGHTPFLFQAILPTRVKSHLARFRETLVLAVNL
jgi:O-methyltransferase domain